MNLLLFLLPLSAITQEMPKSPAEKNAAIAILPSTPTRSTILIEAKARCDDIMKAYDLLKKEKPTFRISIHTNSGQTLSNIIDLTAMPQGTLLLVKLSTAQGVKAQLLSVDDFLDFFFS